MRVAELETLFTANVDQIEAAEQKVKQTGQRIESNPIEQKIAADAKGALGSMDRVEQRAKQLVSKDQVLRLDADVRRGEASVKRITDRLENLRLRALGGLDVTADTKRAEADLLRTQRSLDGLKKARAMIEVAADPSDALEGIQQVENSAKRIVSMSTALQINANTAKAQNRIEELKSQIDYLRARPSTVQVEADVARAESRLKGAEAALRDLDGMRAMMLVDVNEGGAKQKLKGVADIAEDAGGEGGRRGGAALSDGLVGALASIPIAGAVVGVGAVAAKALVQAFEAGLAQEKGRDRLQALTGISEVASARLARLAGEAYANSFGDSIESNMDTTRLGLQFNILDEKSTTRSAQKTIEGLAGIADVLGEDVQPVAEAVAALLSSGLAKSAENAYDILAVGAREGLNRNQDLLDSLTEYPALLKSLGLSAEEWMGLVSQSMQAGARNSDLATDALKEFQIRGKDGSKLSAEGFKLLGLSAKEMTADVAAGGSRARDALAEVLDELRKTEDPVKRNAAAVALFGTQAEDLADSIFAMDLSNAVDQLNGVEGAAQRMFDTMSDNDATKLEGAKRNIEVAADGIQGALAVAFSEPLGEFADWVSSNRGPLLQFFVDLANGALDFAETASDGLGDFVTGPLADMAEGVVSFLKLTNFDPFKDWTELDALVAGMRDFDKTTDEMSDGIAEARNRLNEFAEPAVAMAVLNDRTRDVAKSIGEVGDESGKLEDQVRGALEALKAEGDAAAATGEDAAELESRYKDGTDALLDQLEATKMTRKEAQSLINTVIKGARGKLTFDANTTWVQGRLNELVNRNNGRTITFNVVTKESRVTFAGSDHVATSRATGGPIHGPGSGTSDDVPIWASNGEHMLTADEVKKAGGHNAVYRLREAIRSGQLREALSFATGGEISLARAKQDVRNAEARVRASRGKKKDIRQKAAADLDAAEERLASVQASFRESQGGFYRSQRRGENQDAGMNGRGLTLVDELLEISYATGGKTGSKQHSNALRLEKQYVNLEKSAEKAADAVERSSSKLEGFKDQVAAIASTVSSAFRRVLDPGQWKAGAQPFTQTRMVDGIAVTTTGSQSVQPTAASIASGTKANEAGVKRVTDKLEKLRKMGFNPAYVLQLAQMGMEAEPVVDALLKATASEVKTINSSYTNTGKLADAAGLSIANAQIGEGGKELGALVTAAQKQLANDEKYARDVQAKLQSVTNQVIAALKSGYATGVRRAAGGPIFGPGTTTSDSIPMWGSNDEHMWSAAEVKGAGGHGNVERLRKAALTGELAALTTVTLPVPAAAVSTQITVAPQFHNPIVANLEQEAWEAAQIVAGSVGGARV